MSWTPWEMADARKKWNELVMSSMQRDPSYYISQNSIPAECKLAALKGQSPTQGTNHGRGSAGSAHYHGSLNKKGNHHGDYTDTTPSTNSESRYTVDGVDGTEAGPRSLVQNLTSPDVHDYAIWHWNADDGTKNARMKDPAPMYELCDFMNFTLENVAILAPVGGLLARDWAIPRQRRVHPLPSGISGTGSGAVDHGNDPRITIRGSISAKHRGLLGQYGDIEVIENGLSKRVTGWSRDIAKSSSTRPASRRASPPGGRNSSTTSGHPCPQDDLGSGRGEREASSTGGCEFQQ